MTATITISKDTWRLIEAYQGRESMGSAGEAFSGILSMTTALMDDESQGETLCIVGKAANDIRDFSLEATFRAIAEKRTSSEELSARINDTQMADLTRIHQFLVSKKILVSNSKVEDALEIAVRFAHVLLDRVQDEKKSLSVRDKRLGVSGRLIEGFNL